LDFYQRLSLLKDKELLNQLKAIEKMNNNDKSVVRILIDAFLLKRKYNN
jgi:hypothetical protein